MSRAYLPLLDENRYDLGIPAVNLEMDPAHWLPDLILKADVIANELMLALDLEEAYPYLGAGAPLDHLADALRRAGSRPRRAHLKQWQHFDRTRLAQAWQTVTDVIETRLDWRR